MKAIHDGFGIWRSMKKETPKENGDYLVYTDYGEIEIAFWDDSYWIGAKLFERMIDTRNNRAISPSLNLVKARVKQGFMEYRQREAVSNIYTLDKTKKGYWLSVSLGQIHKIISNSQSVVFHAGRCFKIICYAKITIKEMRRYKTPLNFK